MSRNKMIIAVVVSTLTVAVGALAQGEGRGDAAAGKGVYEANCLLCHGASGQGDGPAAAALNPKPMNFTDASRMSKINDETRFKAVTEGGAAVGASPIMPAFRDTLSEQQIHDVLAYIRQNFSH